MLKKLKHCSPKKRKIYIFVCVLVAIFLIAGAILSVYFFSAYYIKTYGITLSPSRDFKIHDIRYYLQNDPEWGGDLIGHSDNSVGSAGCLIACASSAITDLGITVTPKEFNKKLTSVDGFQDSDLIWYKINEAFAEIDYKYSRFFSSATIESDLESGLLPIVSVKYKGNGIAHWLLIVGAEDDEFLVYDPLNTDKKPIKLSTHGNVHSYRVLVPSNSR